MTVITDPAASMSTDTNNQTTPPLAAPSAATRQSFSRFNDRLCEEVLSRLSLEDQTRCECVSKQFRRCAYRRVYRIDLTAGDHSILVKRLKRPPQPQPPPTPAVTTAPGTDDKSPNDSSGTSDGNGVKTAAQEPAQPALPAVTLSLEQYRRSLPAMDLTLYGQLLRKCPHIRVIDFADLIQFTNIDAIVDTLCAYGHRVTDATIGNNYIMAISPDCVERFLRRFGPQLKRLCLAIERTFLLAAGGLSAAFSPDWRPVPGIEYCRRVKHVRSLYYLPFGQWFPTADTVVDRDECLMKKLLTFRCYLGPKDMQRFKSFVGHNADTLRRLSVTTHNSTAAKGSVINRAEFHALIGQIGRCRRLRRLEVIAGYTQQFDYDFSRPVRSQLADKCPELRELSIGFRFVSRQLAYQLYETLRHFSCLKRLTIDLQWPVVGDVRPQSIRNAPLRPVLTDEHDYHFLCKSLAACRRLEQLTMQSMVINDVFFYNIDKHLPALKRLTIMASYRDPMSLTETTVKVLARLSLLESVYFSGDQPLISDQCVHDWIGKCPAVESITFGRRRFATHIEAIRAGLPVPETSFPPTPVVPFSVALPTREPSPTPTAVPPVLESSAISTDGLPVPEQSVSTAGPPAYEPSPKPIAGPPVYELLATPTVGPPVYEPSPTPTVGPSVSEPSPPPTEAIVCPEEQALAAAESSVTSDCKSK